MTVLDCQKSLFYLVKHFNMCFVSPNTVFLTFPVLRVIKVRIWLLLLPFPWFGYGIL